jgi:hypothetical protein
MNYFCHSVSISYIWIMFINMRLMDKYIYSIIFYSRFKTPKVKEAFH